MNRNVCTNIRPAYNNRTAGSQNFHTRMHVLTHPAIVQYQSSSYLESSIRFLTRSLTYTEVMAPCAQVRLCDDGFHGGLRPDGPIRAGPADRTQIVDMMLMKRGNHTIQRILHQQTQISRAGRRLVRLGVNLVTGLMNVDLLPVEF